MTPKKREGRPPTQLRMPQYCFPPPLRCNPYHTILPVCPARATTLATRCPQSSSPYLICFLDKKSVCSWNGVAVSWFSFHRSGSRYPYVFLRA